MVLAAVDKADQIRQIVLSGRFPAQADDLGKQFHGLAAGRTQVEDAKSNKLVLPPESKHNAGIIKYKDADGHEHVVVNTGAGDDSVSIANYDSKAPYTHAPKLHVAVNGTDHSFDLGADLTVRTGEGNDLVTGYQVGTEKSMPPAPPVTVIGGTGDDSIATMGGADTIVGGPGENHIGPTGDPSHAPGWVDESPDGGLVRRVES